MIKYIYILLGLFFVGLGFVGIAIPGLPTTPFLLVSAFFFVKSSERLYNWLINHRTFGKTIIQYRQNKVISTRVKIISITLMIIMVSISTIFMIDSNIIKVIVVLLGLTGMLFILSHKSYID